MFIKKRIIFVTFTALIYDILTGHIRQIIFKNSSSLTTGNVIDNIPQKVLVQIFDNLQHNTISDIVKKLSAESKFTGEPIRIFPKQKRFFSSSERKCIFSKKQDIKSISEPNCEKWAVVITSRPLTEGVRRLFYRKDWCLVIVGDKHEPKVDIFQVKLET